MLGQIFEHSTSVDGVNIINNTTQVSTISDVNGMFSIVVKEGDVLVFSSVNLDPLKHRITAEDLNLDKLQIKMTAKEIELKEVVVNENSQILPLKILVLCRMGKRHIRQPREKFIQPLRPR